MNQVYIEPHWSLLGSKIIQLLPYIAQWKPVYITIIQQPEEVTTC